MSVIDDMQARDFYGQRNKEAIEILSAIDSRPISIRAPSRVEVHRLSLNAAVVLVFSSPGDDQSSQPKQFVLGLPQAVALAKKLNQAVADYLDSASETG